MSGQEFADELIMLINDALRDIAVSEVLAGVYIAHRELEVMFDMDAVRKFAALEETK